jgi:hypothetical protein
MRPKTPVFVLLFAMVMLWGTYFALETVFTDRPENQIERVPESESEIDSNALPPSKATDGLKKSVSSKSKKQATASQDQSPAVNPINQYTTKRVASDAQRSAKKFAANQQRNKDRFVKLEALYHKEPRDRAWAISKERRIRYLIEEADQDKLLISIACRSTICRMESTATDYHHLFALMQIDALREEISEEMVMLPKGEAETRTLITLFVKRGYTIDQLTRNR